MDAFLIAFLSIIFLSIGSLTSVLIHRLILMEFQKTDINLFFPPSHCINCGAKISLINLIPILGYLLQRGRCIKCNASISITYLMHEIIHLAVGLSIYLFEGFSYQALITYILFSIFYICVVVVLESLETQASVFKRSSEKMSKDLWWQKTKVGSIAVCCLNYYDHFINIFFGIIERS